MVDFPNNPVEGDKFTDPNGVVWKFSGDGWKEFDPPTLQSMSDVYSGTPNVGDKLVWDGDQWAPQPRTIKMSDMTDIVGTPAGGDYMVYDGTNFNMSSDDNDLVMCLWRDESGVDPEPPPYPVTGNQVIRYYSGPEIDTHNMAGSNYYIRCKQDGFYRIDAFASFYEEAPLPVRYEFQQYLYIVYASGTGGEFGHYDRYENMNLANFNTTAYQYPQLYYNCVQTRYANLLVGDYIYQRYRSLDHIHYDRNYPIHQAHVSLAVQKIDLLR